MALGVFALSSVPPTEVTSKVAESPALAVQDVQKASLDLESSDLPYSQGNSLLAKDIEPVNYKQIIEETADEEYRETVDVVDNKFVVMRTEGEDSAPLEEESWYESFGTGYEEVMRTEGDDGQVHAAYLITTPFEDVWDVVDATNITGTVDIAEPEYVYAADGVPTGTNEGREKQWYLEDQHATDVWSVATTYGNTSGEGVVVAVIDTGIDLNHEDLANNIWVNTAELVGQDGVDDDGNGYVDDVYGINLIDPGKAPVDDHGHGTHVAGIIAMEDNDKGGVGLAYKAKVMAIKAAGVDGTFASSDIAKAVKYASINGADVINMSFGGPAHSAVVESALQDAFNTSVLVASAGNGGVPTADAPMKYERVNVYPAAYSYVLGVMATDSTGDIAYFSNWDWKSNYGPEYEIAAPGVDMYSTLPNNRYASWSGTSMAAPMVSAAAAILRSNLDDEVYSSRYIMGQIASATSERAVKYLRDEPSCIYSKLSLGDSLTKKPKPNIGVNNVYVFDSPDISPANNGDGIIQPGETLALAVELRNQWGAATDVRLAINATSAGGIDNPYLSFGDGEMVDRYYQVPMDDIGTFGTLTNGFIYDDETDTVIGCANPILVKVSEDAPNDLNILLNINYFAKNALDSADEAIYHCIDDYGYVANVVRGTILEGKISGDTTLTADNYYIVKNSVLIPRGVTVNVEPGTQIQFWASDQEGAYADTYLPFVQVEGVLNFNGTEEAPIDLFPGKDWEAYVVEISKKNNGIVNMSYVNITNPYLEITTGNHLNCVQAVYNVKKYYHDRFWYTGCSVVADEVGFSRFSNFKGFSDALGRDQMSGTFSECLFDNCYLDNYITIVSISGRNPLKFSVVDCSFLLNGGRRGVVNVGNCYTDPIYETATDIISFNGKKYVLYSFDQYYFPESEGNKDALAIEAVLRKNGGHVAAIDLSDSGNKDLLHALYRSVYDQGSNAYMYVGYWFDSKRNAAVSSDGSSVPVSLAASSLSSQTPVVSAWCHDPSFSAETGEIADVRCVMIGESKWWGSASGKYVLAEYPEDVDDSRILNPSFSLDDIDTENTKLYNNAFLNRLVTKNPDDWMKVGISTQDNSVSYMATNNYWGTTDETLIKKQTVGFSGNISLADIVTSPYLEQPAESTYPCVSDIYITDADGNKVKSVGNGAYSVHVLFNRDMDQTIQPMVTYGPDDPYTDYSVTGNWASAREWVGTANIKVVINQGQQYFRVKDAAAADDAWLTNGTDWGRFMFTIGAAGAEALTLQGVGEKGCINLTWTQDEFETLAGYNIYRSETGEEGSFKKINSSVIDKMEYSDASVVSGKPYYYYFTVVDTAMAESHPSNVIVRAALDDQPPVIKCSKLADATLGLDAYVTATVTDNVGVNGVYLNYRMQGQAEYKTVQMTNIEGDTYRGVISKADLSAGTLEYYVSAADSVQYGYAGTEDKPYTVPVESSAVIMSVSVSGENAGDTVSGTVKGVNFFDGITVRIDGADIATSFVSENELRFEFAPAFMGMKKVELCADGAVLVSRQDAFTVRDVNVSTSINEDAFVIGGRTEWAYLPVFTNYEGDLYSLEITQDYTGNVYYEPSISYEQNSVDYDWTNRTKTTSYTMAAGTHVGAGEIAHLCAYNVEGTSLPRILSLKINGVEVENVADYSGAAHLISTADYVPVEGVSVDKSEVSLSVGDTFAPVVSVSPRNASLAGMVAIDYPESLLKQNSDGSFTALRGGSAGVTYSCDGKQAVVRVTVEEPPVLSILPDKDTYRGVVGETVTVNMVVNPDCSNAYIQRYDGDWSSDGISEVSEDNNGRTRSFKLLKPGVYAMRVCVMNEGDPNPVYGSFTIEVIENTAYPEIQEDVVALLPNQLHELSVQLQNRPEGFDAALIWSSSNPDVASVSADGVIRTAGVGCAVLTAKVEGSAESDSVIVLVGSDSMDYALGDVNMDGSVTAADSMLALKLSLVSDVAAPIKRLADVNADGQITASDAMRILKFVTGAIKEF